MEFIILGLLIVVIKISGWNISKLEKQVAQQQKQLDALCQRTGQESLSSCYISEELKSEVIQLKDTGKDVEAVKKIRAHTSMSLLDAKEYIDKL